ncbi:acyl-CoA dehydrogenase [Novosphingobium marinum]|uniref:Alkylation response protein AidB-like acyl-CoA dehydrogenase n=1 Tax=Novosphingobium marinum TaxID=1514948 RepID=A0A7Y9XT01_9SPHN|nr:acyl-CoA dehydrogenase family protein [Novosphingobium marinum]NYH94016.1 alkylation response protein AidB-like acyl-CoA dehydrogenase [Novosphingobium marinum]GGC18964.1 acyl-CoA dehydrogenase [Novosphingobium marinum]
MQPCYSKADEEFRAEVRSFIRENLPEDLRKRARWDYHPRRDDQAQWCRILDAKGWSMPHWPKQYGGPGWTGIQKFIFEEEARLACAPTVDRIGPELVAPVIYSFGSDEMKDRFLPGIRSGETFWAQGFSEPGAGSDLASLRTRAVREGDEYVVNGQKTWTTEGHHADWIFLLVRTDTEAKPQQGISALLVDLRSPGIQMRPIWTMDEGVSVNEVFFEDVRVPAENLVGDEGSGWTYAKFLLMNERTNSAEVPHTKRDIAELREIAGLERKDGRPLIEDQTFRRKLARIEIDTLALEYAVLRVLSNEDDPANANVASLVKVRGSELRQRVADLATEALGDAGLAVRPNTEGEHRMLDEDLAPPVPDYGVGISAKAMFRRATTIYGGANEIQRTLIAKMALGL